MTYLDIIRHPCPISPYSPRKHSSVIMVGISGRSPQGQCSDHPNKLPCPSDDLVLSRTMLVLYNGSQLGIGLKWGEMYYRCRCEHFMYLLILYKMGKHAPKTVSSISRQSDSQGRGSMHLAYSGCQRGSGFHRGMCLTTQQGFFRSFKPKAQVELRHTRFQR